MLSPFLVFGRLYPIILWKMGHVSIWLSWKGAYCQIDARQHGTSNNKHSLFSYSSNYAIFYNWVWWETKVTRIFVFHRWPRLAADQKHWMELLWLPRASEFRSVVIQRSKPDLEEMKRKPDPENRSFLFNCAHAVKIETISAQVQISTRVFIISQTQRIAADLWEQATCNSPCVVFTQKN